MIYHLGDEAIAGCGSVNTSEKKTNLSIFVTWPNRLVIYQSKQRVHIEKIEMFLLA